MCTGKCAKCIAVVLYPLALISIICNIILFFPDWSTKYAQGNDQGDTTLTPEVTYMGGLFGGGIMVLIPAIHIHLTGKQGCCANRCGMFLSIGFAGLGMAGALYSMSVAAVGLSKGPVCRYFSLSSMQLEWGRPFDNNGTYLSNQDSWKLCVEPENVVEFNVALFFVLVLTAVLELGLCGFQMVNGLFGCICGTCRGKESA